MVLIAGDVTWHPSLFSAVRWMNREFRQWCEDIGVPIVLVAGNHDECLVGYRKDLISLAPNVTYLEDEIAKISDMLIFGSPWTKTFMDWSFMKDEEGLERHFGRLPLADIYVVHSPPYGYGDWSSYGNEHTGSPMLLEKIRENQPRVVVWGHIHNGSGQWNIGNTLACNVSYVDDDYRPRGELLKIEYNGRVATGTTITEEEETGA